MEYHQPVLLDEVIDQLQVEPNKIYVDATLGHGGHTIEILKLGGTVYGFDQDLKNLEIATNRIAQLKLDKNFHPIHANFNQLVKIVKTVIKQNIDGLLVDLGLSQNQQTASDRGFSFNDCLSIDMRLDPKKQKLSAENIINTYSFEQLYDIFTKYGQEKYSKPIILKIIRERQKSPIKNGKRLADIARNYYQEHHIKTNIDPSTKIFLSLRIVVNNEFNNLKKILDQSLKVINHGQKACFISFHSGEDRIIKQFIKSNLVKKTILSASKPISPSFLEIKTNPLSRSSLLRSYTIY